MNQLTPDRAIVVISDCADFDYEKLSVTNRDVDRVHRSYVDELIASIQQFHSNVICYCSPEEFMLNIAKHKHDLVFPYWYGANSRNRHALIPSICEAAGIQYIGGDTYTKTVTNDKQLCKWHVERSGLKAPHSTLLYHLDQINEIDGIPFPMVIKPLFEGTSLGITQDNLVNDKENATRLIHWVFEEFGAPVMVESFASGSEVSVCMIGRHGKIEAWASAERYKVGNDRFLQDKLYGFGEKNSEEGVFALRSMNNKIPIHVLDACFRLFGMLDKVEYMRVDGRLNGDDFTIIELTPESHLGHDAEFCGAFTANGYTYHQVIKLIIDNCCMRYRSM